MIILSWQYYCCNCITNSSRDYIVSKRDCPPVIVVLAYILHLAHARRQKHCPLIKTNSTDKYTYTHTSMLASERIIVIWSRMRPKDRIKLFVVWRSSAQRQRFTSRSWRAVCELQPFYRIVRSRVQSHPDSCIPFSGPALRSCGQRKLTTLLARARGYQRFPLST